MILFLCLPAASAGEDWIELFNGRDLEGWMSPNEGEPGAGWVVEDGVLHRAEKADDLISREEFTDFELEFEWKVAPGANSGVKYRLRKTPRGWLGAEYQVIDDEAHPDARDADRRAASLYDLVAADGAKPLKAVGDWNQGRIVVEGPRIEHWLNGERVLVAETDSEEWDKTFAASKFAGVEGFAGPGPGRILLQDHGDEVWFRKIRIRPSDGAEKSRPAR